MTAAQLAANCENAQHSSGPRTEEGKKRARLNAFRHTGQIIMHTPEDAQAFVFSRPAIERQIERRLRLARAIRVPNGAVTVMERSVRESVSCERSPPNLKTTPDLSD